MASPIGRVILQLCDRRGITQKKVAEVAKIDASNLSKIIAGTLGTKGPVRARIAKAFGLDVEEFDEMWRGAEPDDEPLPRTSAGDGLRIVDAPILKQCVVEVQGDSMEPVLLPGDRVTVKPVPPDDQRTIHDTRFSVQETHKAGGRI